MRKRLLSLAIALALCLGLIAPVFASASGTGYLSDSYEVFHQVAAGDWSMSLVAPQDYGLKDKAGNVIIPAKYSGMYLFRNLIFAAVGGDTDSRAGVVGTNVVPPLYGIIDLNQNVILPFQYERISPIYQRSDTTPSATGNVYPAEGFTGLFRIQKSGLSGVIAENYSIVIPPNYFNLEYMEPGYFKCSSTNNKYAVASGWSGQTPIPDCLWALYDTAGKQIFPMEYQEINFLGDGLFAVKKNGLWGVINISGQVVVPLNYQNVTGRYGSAFIVTDYREQYRNKPKGDEPIYLGDLWKHQGIVGVGGKVLVDFEKYQKISVDTAGRFTCSVWTGGYRTGGYIGIGESLIPTYANEYTYEYINYKDLNVSDDVSSITAPTVPSTPTNPTTPITSSFSDVPANAYYAAPVAWAVSNNITNGTSSITFSPNDTCTRGQIVTFLYRAANA